MPVPWMVWETNPVTDIAVHSQLLPGLQVVGLRFRIQSTVEMGKTDTPNRYLKVKIDGTDTKR